MIFFLHRIRKTIRPYRQEIIWQSLEPGRQDWSEGVPDARLHPERLGAPGGG